MKQQQLLHSRLIFLAGAFMAVVLLLLIWLFIPKSGATAANERIISIHYDGQEQTVATDAQTVGEVLDRANIKVAQHDLVEPATSEKLVAANYSINVYRARPITIIEGTKRYRVMSPHQSPKKIVAAAGLKAYDEDIFELSRIDDFLGEGGAGLKLTVTRSTPVKAILYDQPVEMRTQAKTVKDFLSEKKITLQPGDKLWPGEASPITPDMAIAIFRDGSQAVKEEELPFATEKVQDKDHEIGYKQVKEVGAPGKRFVIYQIEQKNGKEVRTELHSIVIAEPKKQIEVIGTKTAGFSGTFAEALARLRSCEGSYTSNTGNGYYGAYQFDRQTWGGYAGYPVASDAPPEVQDQKAWETYKRRGWQPWPSCSRSQGLQDIYR